MKAENKAENLELWNRVKSVPETAQKVIPAGRLKGMTEISPMWRIYKMTETFGPIGSGWEYRIERLWTEPGSDGQVLAFALVNVSVNDNNWVPGVGGSMLVKKESTGMYSSDEAYKMAITDAIGSALKMFGVGAEIYSGGSDFSKYSGPDKPKLVGQYQHMIGSRDGLGLYCMMLQIDESTKADLHNSWGAGQISAHKKMAAELEAIGFEQLSNVRNGIEQDDPLLVVENLDGITLDGKRYLWAILEEDQKAYVKQAVDNAK
jgi:hypothetical protein